MEGTGDAERGAVHEAATGGTQPTTQTTHEGGTNTMTEERRYATGEPPHAPIAAWKRLQLPTVCEEAQVQLWHDEPITHEKNMDSNWS